MTVHNLYINNSMIVEHVLTNPMQDPIYVNDATVGVTILDKNREPIPDMSWPVNMDYVLQTNGLYRTSLLDLPSIKRDRKYYVVIDVLGSNGLKGQFETEAVGAVKDV